MRFSTFLFALFLLAVSASFSNGSNLISAQVPTGTLIEFAGPTCPPLYIAANGASLPRTGGTSCGGLSCANLFAAIGTNWGTVDGSHFNAPDMRGLLPRGLDGSAGRDPDEASRTALATGGSTANNVGSYESDAFRSHNHQQSNNTTGGGGLQVGTGQTGAGMQPNGFTYNTGGNETRPINVYVNYCVKF